jgi:hypothetical protein
MNERIRELAEQAREYAITRHPVSNITLSVNSDLFEQKFAQLIVQECIDIISPYTVSMNRPGEEYLHPIQEIKKNFGVEK